MSLYHSPKDLSHLPWVKVWLDYKLDAYWFRVEHRDCFIVERLDYHDCESIGKVTDFMVSLQKEINFYLDAIWG